MREYEPAGEDLVKEIEDKELAEASIEELPRHARHLLERSRQLLQIQRKITSRLSLDEVLDSIIRSASELLQVGAAEVLLLNPEDETFTIRASETVRPSPLGARKPLAERPVAERAIRERRLVAVGDTDAELEWRIPILIDGEPVRATASAPLQIEREVIGALSVYSSKPRHFTAEDQQTLAMFAEGAAIAVSNARLYADAERGRKRLQAVLDTVPSGIIVVEGREARVAFMNRRSQEFFGAPLEIGKPLPAFLATSKLMHPNGRPFLSEEFPISRSMRSGEVVHGEELVIESESGKRNYLLLGSAPLYDERGNLYGAVISTEDITALRETQEALRQAYARERRVSETLQQALLPKIGEKLDGLRIASVYRAALEEAQIGGDFFDVFCPSPGLVGLVIGDVAGKGVEAAVRTALTRYSLTAYAYIDPSPTSVIEALNKVIIRENVPESFVTLFYGLLDIRGRSISYVNAGQEPPLCLAPDGNRIDMLPNTGMPLGIHPAASYEQRSIPFVEGSKILLYTDGVTEARSKEGFFGLERLKEFLLAHRTDHPRTFTDRLIEHLQAFSYPHLRDDIAVLLVEMESEVA